MAPERMWSAYKEFCHIRERALMTGSCDLTGLHRVCPTILMPLVDFLRRTEVPWIPPNDGALSECISAAVQERPRIAHGGPTYTQVVKLPKDYQGLAGSLADFSRRHDWGSEYGGRNALMYLIGELVHNVYDHSDSSNSYLMAHRDDWGKDVELAVFDDGVTMAGSLRKSGIVVEDDVLAIAMAMNGLSSKGEGRRGYGLRSNVRMCVQGLRGSVLAVSGGGAIEFCAFEEGRDDVQEGYELNDNVYRLAGTLASVRIPFQKKGVNIYDFA